MDLEIIMISEINHTEQDKYAVISRICVIYKQNKQSQKKTETKRSMNTENPQVLAGGEGGREGWGNGGREWEVQGFRYRYKVNKSQG